MQKRFKYPKFFILILTIAVAYLIFNSREFSFFSNLKTLGYFGTLITGIFFAYGFTAAPATAILLILSKQQNIVLMAVIAGFGALIGDLIIFRFIRESFSKEIRKISKERITLWLNKRVPSKIKKYLLVGLAGIVIASPLPDEIGVTLLAAYKTIPQRTFIIISYVLNSLGILVILFLTKIF